jgi:hypothetical protein
MGVAMRRAVAVLLVLVATTGFVVAASPVAAEPRVRAQRLIGVHIEDSCVNGVYEIRAWLHVQRLPWTRLELSIDGTDTFVLENAGNRTATDTLYATWPEKDLGTHDITFVVYNGKKVVETDTITEQFPYPWAEPDPDENGVCPS